MPIVKKTHSEASTDSKAFPLIVSYYAGDDYYYKAAEQLKKDCEGLGLDYEIVEAPLKKPFSWIEGCRYKIKFINETLEKFKRPVLWVDVDCRLLALPAVLKNCQADMAFFLRAFRYFRDYDPLVISRTIDPSLVYYGYTPKGRGFAKLMKTLESEHSGVATDDYFLQEAWIKFDQPLSVLLLPPDMRALEIAPRGREFFYFGRSGSVADHKDKAEQHPVAMHTALWRKKVLVKKGLELIDSGKDQAALVLFKRAYELDKTDQAVADKVTRLKQRVGGINAVIGMLKAVKDKTGGGK